MKTFPHLPYYFKATLMSITFKVSMILDLIFKMRVALYLVLLSSKLIASFGYLNFPSNYFFMSN